MGSAVMGLSRLNHREQVSTIRFLLILLALLISALIRVDLRITSLIRLTGTTPMKDDRKSLEVA